MVTKNNCYALPGVPATKPRLSGLYLTARRAITAPPLFNAAGLPVACTSE